MLSQEDYNTLLNIKLKNKNVVFKKANYISLTEKLEGFLGEHTNLELIYAVDGIENVEYFFIKSKPLNKIQNAVADSLQAYEKEEFFYEILMKAFSTRGYDVSFAAEYYLGKDGQILIMEDLKSKGFASGGRENFYDVNKAKSALKALARLHGCSFILEEHKSKELNVDFRLDAEYPAILAEKFVLLDEIDHVGTKYFSECFDYFIQTIDLIDDETIDWKEDFKSRLQKIDFHKIFNYNLKGRKALGHGDLWANNMLSKLQPNNAYYDWKIVDYQTLRYYNPAYDVTYLIFTNTRKSLRDKHYNDLLNYYYDSLENVLKLQNVSIDEVYPKKDFLYAEKYYRLFTRFQSACAHTYTFMNKDNLEFKDIISDERIEICYHSFKHDPRYRENITEDLKDLYGYLLDWDFNI